MFIQTEDTPNPATLKFLPGRDVLGDARPREFPNLELAEASPLAARIFTVDGVKSVFLGADFVTVTKWEEVDWAAMKAPVLAAIMDHFVSGAPVLADAAAGEAPADGATGAADYEGEDAEIVEQILELLDTRVRPAVAQDGGDIIFHRYEPGDGIVFLTMRGACAGCPSSTMTLKAGIENMLKHYIPEVTRVEAVGL
ncbi:MAG: NifU family protein [Pseudomonadota bacterium]